MDLEVAITTALAYEDRVCAVYRDAEAATDDPEGRRIFGMLLAEEVGHVRYLQARLQEWRAEGRVRDEPLTTTLPASVARSERNLRRKFTGRDARSAVGMLRRALVVEAETSAFYRWLLGTLGEEDRRMFARFDEIEAGHYAFVQSQIDGLTQDAHWFVFKEFDLDG
jgi:rubrerythrin